MNLMLLATRVVMSVVFVAAGLAKLLDLKGSRKAITDFGLPSWTAKPLGVGLPMAEIAVAILLLPMRSAWIGAIGALALLLAFSTVIAVSIALGRKPDCHCFGNLRSEPVGWATLVRSGVLAGFAAVLVWQARTNPGLSIQSVVSSLTAGELLTGAFALLTLIAFAGLFWLVLHLSRQNGRLLLRMDALEAQHGTNANGIAPAPAGLPIGSHAPSFALPGLSGDSIVTLDTLRAARHPIALIFSDPECGPCSALLPDMARWEREYATTLTIVLISRGSQKANHVKIGVHRLKYVLLQKDREVAEAYKANGTPGAVLIDLDGKIASSLAMGSPSIAALVARGAGAPTVAAVERSNGAPKLRTEPFELKIGDSAPPLKLPDLSGEIVDISSFRGREILVLFWNPSCGFCTKMLLDLKRWEEDRPAEAPQLLVVSSGTVEANRAMGLRAPVVLDQNFMSRPAFHVPGTPAAVLVDANGKIASGVAIGATAVFEMANAQLRTSV